MKRTLGLSRRAPDLYDPEGAHQTVSAMYVSLNSFQPCDLPSLLSSLQPIAPLLDTLSDVVFFIKDTQARYAFVNHTLARRCGFRHSHELLGLTADSVFPNASARCTPRRTAACSTAAASWPTSSNCTCTSATSRCGA
ncbi:PAS domain-containing protein [Pseudomonas qingdaonensis]|nr:PAS domain-containing protein [Pseudomonas qingdaonensis]